MGPYRSGTSLSCQVLSALGVDFGPAAEFQLVADRYNPGGYFQRRDVVEANASLIEACSPSVAAPVTPEQILASVADSWPARLDLGWTEAVPVYGLKDPRFSATLLTWLARGLLPRESLRIVRVVRSLDAVARSSVAHREVGSFCDYDFAAGLDMASIYDRYADWHVSHLGVPSIEVHYEDLVAKPHTVVGDLAEFLGQTDGRRIQRACAAVGKRRALVRYYTHKFSHPSLVFDTLRKTLAAWAGRL
jgi:hypothetical protein